MKYLFGVQFLDGTFLEQTPQDVSKINPLKSAYYDILQEEEKGNPPVKFCLVGEGCSYLVDLYDGHFEAGIGGEQGAIFWLYRPLDNLVKLIYYRDVSFSISSDFSDSHKDIVFNFGWQIPGTDIKRIISLK